MASKWTEDEDKYLLAHYGRQETEFLARVLDRSPDAVRSRLYKIQRKPKENEFMAVEFSFFLDRANRPVPTSVKKLPSSVITNDARLAKWTGKKRRGGNAYRNTRTGYRADLGINLRSSWEANVARIMSSYEIPYQFEPAVFQFPIKRGNRAYTPDFYLPATDEWIEVKGYFDDASRIKMKRFKKYYPEQWDNLTMIISKSSRAAENICADLDVPSVLYYQDIAKVFSTRIANWEG